MERPVNQRVVHSQRHEMGLKNRNMATGEAGLNAGRGSGSFWSGRQEGFPPVPLILVKLHFKKV